MDAGDTRSVSNAPRPQVAWALGFILIVTFLIRAVFPGQPIVENYVGRQIPTAMVARNLERGSGLLYPQLDTAPFPNYFLVEPPLYELLVVAVRRASGLPLAAAGRIVSAMATVLAALGVFALARNRHGSHVALWSACAFGVFPLTIRYGRAFQPDALMLGAVLAGLACWDRFAESQRRRWACVGWFVLAVGFALKITSAVLVLPLMLVILRGWGAWPKLASVGTIVPALLWYAWANWLIDGGGAGSGASADNRAIWAGVADLRALVSLHTFKWVFWFLIVRAFTPLGAGLAVLGFLRGAGRPEGARLWLAWAISVSILMALVAQKLHHEYYWLILAPVAAVGIGLCLDQLLARRRALALSFFTTLALSSCVFVRSTWQSPVEWAELPAAARAIQRAVPPASLLASSEAILFESDRRGCRMEWTEAAARRAAAEWRMPQPVHSPLELLALYRAQGARYFADLGGRAAGAQRKVLHDAIRRRYKVIVDRPEVIICDLVDSRLASHAN
jgi:hypothetical protein